jgi:hypothetical protein
MTKLERDFERHLLEKLEWAENLIGYSLAGIREFIVEFGAVQTAKMLVDPNHVLEPDNGFTILVKHGLANLSVEQAMIDFAQRGLFTAAEIKAAKARIAIFANRPNAA